jgi:hypothetical protein
MMNLRSCFIALIGLAMASGCQSSLTSAAIDPAKALAGPYRLHLSLDRKSASPGDLVYAAIEFENTGASDLWIPRRRELFFGFDKNSKSGSSSVENWESSCDGLAFVRVKPGQTVQYEKGFVVPALLGEISVYLTINRQVTVPLWVKSNPRGVARDESPTVRGILRKPEPE